MLNFKRKYKFRCIRISALVWNKLYGMEFGVALNPANFFFFAHQRYSLFREYGVRPKKFPFCIIDKNSFLGKKKNIVILSRPIEPNILPKMGVYTLCAKKSKRCGALYTYNPHVVVFSPYGHVYYRYPATKSPRVHIIIRKKSLHPTFSPCAPASVRARHQ